MKIVIAKDYRDMSIKAARLVASQVTLNSKAVLGLATGSTPLGMYGELIKMFQGGEISFKEIISFNLDEYIGLKQNDENSYSYYMKENFFKYIDIKAENIHIPQTERTNFDETCKAYDDMIQAYGGISMQVLGIGRNGHIGFNEPDVKFEAKTHVVQLDEDTIHANARFFSSIAEVPTKAISLGLKNIMQSRRIVLLASGKEKAKIVKEMIEGKITPLVPATVLQLHPDVTVVIDEDAAACLDI